MLDIRKRGTGVENTGALSLNQVRMQHPRVESRSANIGGSHTVKARNAAQKGAVKQGLSRDEKVKHLVALLKKREAAAREMKKRIQENSSIIAKGNSFGVDVMAEALAIHNSEQMMLRPSPSPSPSADAVRQMPPAAAAPHLSRREDFARQRQSPAAGAPEAPRPAGPALASADVARSVGADAGRPQTPSTVTEQPPARGCDGRGVSASTLQGNSVALGSGSNDASTPSLSRLKRKGPLSLDDAEGTSCSSSAPREKIARHSAGTADARMLDGMPRLEELGTPCRSPWASRQAGSVPPQPPPQVPPQGPSHSPPQARWAGPSFSLNGSHGQLPPSDPKPASPCKPARAAPDAYKPPPTSPYMPPQAAPAGRGSKPPSAATSRHFISAREMMSNGEAAEPHPEPSPAASAPPTPNAPAAPTTSRSETSMPATGAVPQADLSVKHLKALLSEHRIDFSSCVEKADLQALWNRFEVLRRRPLQELRDSLIAKGVPGSVPHTPDECAAQLLAQDSSPASATSGAATAASPTPAASAEMAAPTRSTSSVVLGDSGPSPEVANREMEAKREVNRILALRRESFRTTAEWGFAVLGATRELASVQRGYRSLWRKLHPDKVEQNATVSRAVEACREAKEACERALSRQVVPGQPRALSYKAECCTPGQRIFRLSWQPPIAQECAPVRRYVVAAYDPAYGKALTVAVLEPDYNEELRRFVSVEELDHYVLSEQELRKMPLLWKQPTATVQVAAANEAGQSNWATLQVALNGRPANPAGSFGAFISKIGSGPFIDNKQAEYRDARVFEEELSAAMDEGDSPDSLRPLIGKQRKALLQSWLQSNECPAEGTKEILVERVLWVLSKRWTS